MYRLHLAFFVNPLLSGGLGCVCPVESLLEFAANASSSAPEQPDAASPQLLSEVPFYATGSIDDGF